MRTEKSLIVEAHLTRAQILLFDSGLDAAGQLAAAEGLFRHLLRHATFEQSSEADGLVCEMLDRWQESEQKTLKVIEGGKMRRPGLIGQIMAGDLTEPNAFMDLEQLVRSCVKLVELETIDDDAKERLKSFVGKSIALLNELQA